MRHGGLRLAVDLPYKRVWSGPVPAFIRLVGATLTEASAEGTAIGVLSVKNGSGTWVFTLTDDAGGKAKVAGTNGVNLQAGAVATDLPGDASFDVTVSATNGTDTLEQTFAISVTA